MVSVLYFVFDLGVEGRVVVSDGACRHVLFEQTLAKVDRNSILLGAIIPLTIRESFLFFLSSNSRKSFYFFLIIFYCLFLIST